MAPMMGETTAWRQEPLRRWHLLKREQEKRITWKEAARRMGVSYRPSNRLNRAARDGTLGNRSNASFRLRGTDPATVPAGVAAAPDGVRPQWLTRTDASPIVAGARAERTAKGPWPDNGSGFTLHWKEGV
jgi:hypothetical protein